MKIDMLCAQATSSAHEDVQLSLKNVLAKVPSHLQRPEAAIICGSGLGPIGDALTDTVSIPYSEIPGFATSTVSGHAGRLLFGFFGKAKRPIVCMHGRVHFYEGWSMSRVVHPVRLLIALGIRLLVVTNAAGGLNEGYSVGDIMMIEDHFAVPLIAGSANPLIGPNNDAAGPRFPPMSNIYPTALRSLFMKSAQECGFGDRMRQGVYGFVSGPEYETRAEARFLRSLGVDSVGMSTAPETVVAAHAGVPVLGLSLITNAVACQRAAPITEQDMLEAHATLEKYGLDGLMQKRGPVHSAAVSNPNLEVSHAEVLEAGQAYGRDVAKILTHFLDSLPYPL